MCAEGTAVWIRVTTGSTFTQTVPYSSTHMTAEWIEETPVVFDTQGNMYAATHSKGVSLDEEFNLLKFDFKTGKILGKVT